MNTMIKEEEDQTTTLSPELENLRGSAQALAQATHECIRQYAWTAIGLAAALGMIAGLLIGGPSKSKAAEPASPSE